MSQTTTVTGTGGDNNLGACILCKVRVGGVAALAGAVQIKRGATVIETLPAATAVGTERQFGTWFPADAPLTINLANAADTLIVVRG